MPKPCSRLRAAFTLIELLVVIAIIAILASILFPVFAQAREKARQANCTSNVKQLALASMMYLQDYDETFPARYFPRQNMPGDGNNVWWIDNRVGKPTLLDPYLKNKQISYCPSQQDQSWLGYGYNGLLVGTVDSVTNEVTVVAEARLQSPAGTILFGDDTFINRTLYTPSQGRKVWGQNFTSPPNKNQMQITDGKEFPYGRHNGVVVMAFCDGHVKWMRVETLWNNGNNKPLYDGF